MVRRMGNGKGTVEGGKPAYFEAITGAFHKEWVEKSELQRHVFLTTSLRWQHEHELI